MLGLGAICARAGIGRRWQRHHEPRSEPPTQHNAYSRTMLIDALRARLGEPDAPSFRLMGEDLALLTADDVRHAVEDQLAQIPPALRAELLVEEADLAAESHRWLKKYNRSLYGRIAGYLELGERLAFRYPWPVVAILGIVQVLGGMDRARAYGLVG